MRPDLLPVRRGGLWGFVDGDGVEVITPRFENATEFVEEVAAVMVGPSEGGVGGTWGYVDVDGAWVLEPQFDEAEPFAEGRAAVNVGARVEHVPRDPVDVVMGGLTFRGGDVMTGGRWGYVDRDGWVVEPRFQSASAYRDGLAVVSEKHRFGFLGRDGRWAVRPGWDLAHPFSEGLAAVRGGWLGRKGWRYIDRSGKVVLRGSWELAHPFAGGLAVVADREKRYAYIDHGGGVALRPPRGITVARSFSEDLAPVEAGEVRRFPDGRLYLASGPWGFMDREGVVVIAPRFRYARPCSGGLAAVQDEHERWGYVDRTGALVVPHRWSAAGPFRDGRAHVLSPDGDTHYIEPGGEVLF